MKKLYLILIVVLVFLMAFPVSSQVTPIKRGQKQTTEQTKKQNKTNRNTKKQTTQTKKYNSGSRDKNERQNDNTVYISISSNVSQSSLYIDGKYYGRADGLHGVSQGSHDLRIEADEYETYYTTIFVSPSKTVFNCQLKKITSYPITFSCNVSDASLYVDGASLGSANGEYNLSPGDHFVKITCPGYTDHTTVISIHSSDYLNYELKKSFSTTSIVQTIPQILQKAIDDMVEVQGGSFLMGATSEQGGDAEKDEKPMHRVSISSYSISKYEVTQELWQAVMGNNPSQFTGDPNLPVENVSWNDCQKFIRKLNQMTGKRFRLPTEAEWEYAARGGSRNRSNKYSGSISIDDVAWCNSNSYSMTHAVGCKKPNELGLYDMSGNVYEWCSDKYVSYDNKVKEISSSSRMCRGGGWDHHPRNCRVSFRYSALPSFKSNNIGLRLAM